MKTRTHLLMGLAVTLPLFGAWPGQAQGQQGDTHYEHQDSRLDVEFPGGTLQEYVERIRKARPSGAANVVVMPNARVLKVPPVTLVAVNVEVAVRLLEGPYVLPDGRDAHVNVMSYTIGDSSDIVMKVVAHLEDREIRASVWNVEEAIANGQSAEELLEAVEAVLSLFSEKADLSFHPPTRLLIARGTDEQLDLVREALEQLTYGAERRREKIEDLRERIEDLESNQHGLMGEIKIGEQEIAATKTRRESVLRARELGGAPPEAVAEADLEVTRAVIELDVYKNQYTRIQAKLESLRNALKELEKPRE